MGLLIRPWAGSAWMTYHSICVRKWNRLLASASHSKQNLALCLSVSSLLCSILSYICMHMLSFCKHNLDFSKQRHNNKEKLRHACILNIDSSFSHAIPDVFQAALFSCICFLCFPTSYPTLKESAANRQLGPPLPRECTIPDQPTRKIWWLLSRAFTGRGMT